MTRDDEKKTSHRQRKKIVGEGVRRLRSKLFFYIRGTPCSTPEQRLRQLDQQLRSQSVYLEADRCEDCDKVRAEEGDETSLCQAHLAQAMGF